MSDTFGYWTVTDRDSYLAGIGGFRDVIQNDTFQFNGTHAFYTYTVVQGSDAMLFLNIFMTILLSILVSIRIYYFVKGDDK